jgi:hypothetical protein
MKKIRGIVVLKKKSRKLWERHGLIDYMDTKAKCCHLTNLADFAGGIYQSLSTEDTASHVGIFNPYSAGV